MNAFRAAEAVLPPPKREANKAWIRDATLTLIHQREEARRSGNYAQEKDLSKTIKKFARADRTAWVDQLLSSRSWEKSQVLEAETGQSRQAEGVGRYVGQQRGARGDHGRLPGESVVEGASSYTR